MMDLKLITLNINGLNCKKKQKLFFDFIIKNNIHFVNLQEHNLKNSNALSEIFYEHFHVILNESLNLKGGTAILIDKCRINSKIVKIEKSSDSRITSVKLTVDEKKLHILNIYAPSGSKFHQDRENVFKYDILYYLRNNLSNTILCGDFNCITHIQDKSRNGTCPISKNLKTMLYNLNIKDIWNIHHNHVEFTYFRENYGSRIDRIYAADFKENIVNIYVQPISFSDHHGVFIEINLKCSVQLGNFYWKLNTKLLQSENIDEDFNIVWNNLCNIKNKYTNINEWWENAAKPGIRKKFQLKGRDESRLKQGLLKYLEIKLRNLYSNMHTHGILDMEEVKRLKNKINNIKDTEMEGVTIRARIQEQLEGETASSSLIGKQYSNKSKPLIKELKTELSVGKFNENLILTKQDEISEYVKSYFEKHYDRIITDNAAQNWFLSFINKTITVEENEQLLKNITEEEIFLILKSFAQNKSPGIDGIPIEFYLKFYDIIKYELCEMIRNSLMGTKLTNTQRKALIILLFKGGNTNYISSFRPISLICVDTKIIAKMIASRIMPLLDKCISKEQFCNKSIIDCSNKTRDLMVYFNENKITGALLNIDLQKAFDSVDHQFLFRVLDKMGFDSHFISWIKILYSEILSVCLINGHQSESFNIHRGVRQGCPLSMILYILSQEPLYQAIKQTRQIEPIKIPSTQIKLLGFADDTTFIVNSDLSIIFIFNILKQFELASSIKLNTSKTKIFGFGEWKGRMNWPYPDIKVEVFSIHILGITFTHDIMDAIEISWKEILSKIKQKINMLSSRSLTIFQRVIIINALILSKVWYTAHTYPLPLKYSKLINKEIFTFLWLSKYNPIKREVLYQDKSSGGLGLLNVYSKSQSIFISTFIKQFLSSNEDETLLKYFCAMRLNPLFNIRILPKNAAFLCPKFLNDTVIEVRKLTRIKNFPNINSGDIYQNNLQQVQLNVDRYILLNKELSFKHMNFKYINIREREIIFKVLHGILTTKQRLHQIKKIDSPLCTLCNVNESITHMFCECIKVKNVMLYYKKILEFICNIRISSMSKLIYFDIKNENRIIDNTVIVLTAGYISNIWYNRDKELSINLDTYKLSILKHHHMLRIILKERMEKLFTESYCKLNESLLNM